MLDLARLRGCGDDRVSDVGRIVVVRCQLQAPQPLSGKSCGLAYRALSRIIRLRDRLRSFPLFRHLLIGLPDDVHRRADPREILDLEVDTTGLGGMHDERVSGGIFRIRAGRVALIKV